MSLVQGNMTSRCEFFDEADVDVAIARFEELSRPAARLENAASRVSAQALACFVTDDWAAIRTMVAEDFLSDDRRRVISTGISVGRDEAEATLKAASDIGFENVTSTVVATRGVRLLIDRLRFSGRDSAPEPFVSEMLRVVEVDGDELMSAVVFFDPDDIDAAFEELNARYLAGEAAPFKKTWSVIVEGYAALNRHEVGPTTPDWTNIDHRHGRAFTPGHLEAYLHATWDLTETDGIYIETVHRLTDRGTVLTHQADGTSREGFDAEWREVVLLRTQGDRISHCEVFDEADLDTALARFDEFDRRT